MLIVIPEVLTADEVKQCRMALLGAEWEDGRKTAGYIAADVKKNRQLPLDSNVGKEMGAKLMQVLSSHPQIIAAALPVMMLPPRFHCYKTYPQYCYPLYNITSNVRCHY